MSIPTALLLFVTGIALILVCTIEDKQDVKNALYFSCHIIDDIWNTRLFCWIFPKTHYKFYQWSHRHD